MGCFDGDDTSESDPFQRWYIADERIDSFMGLLQSPRRKGTGLQK